MGKRIIKKISASTVYISSGRNTETMRLLASCMSSEPARIEPSVVSLAMLTNSLMNGGIMRCTACGRMMRRIAWRRLIAERARGIGLAPLYRLNSGAENLGEIGRGVQAEADRDRRETRKLK